ncbi:MAG: sigma-70 family RNA polymerase sigma factor [Deltaproteobacteria bacterium]|nr:sigma-70 family RNA polymerase sigma factor [Deltaproteobacteria bacterium]
MSGQQPLVREEPESTPAQRKEATSTEERRAADLRDRRLVRRLRQGDQRAFEELVRLYQNRIFGLMLRMIGNRQEAEDLAQEVFITLHRAIGQYRGEGRFYTWLYRIATNTCKNRIKYLRGRNFHRSVPVEDTPEAHDPGEGGPAVRLQGQVAGPEAMAEGTRLQSAIQRELAQLDPEHRLLIILRDIQGLSYQEILGITGLQEGTLKSRLHRARIALKDRLAPYLE